MAEHYSMGTVSVAVWCAKCRKETTHVVNHGRRGSCYDCIKRLEREAKARGEAPKKPKQQNLF